MLQDVRVFVVESEAIVALELQQQLEDAGAMVRLFRAAQEVDVTSLGDEADLVILDARLGAPDAVSLSEALAAKGIATVVATADSAVGPLFGQVPLLEKPFHSQGLLSACSRALADRPPGVRRGGAPL